MLKSFINRVKNLVDSNKENKESADENVSLQTEEVKNELVIEEEYVDGKDVNLSEEVKDVDDTQENKQGLEEKVSENVECEIALGVEDETEIINNIEDESDNIEQNLNVDVLVENKDIYVEEKHEQSENIEEVEEIVEDVLSKEDEEFMKLAKIKRGKCIRAIDVYTKEPQVFKTHKECSKKLKLPEKYIQENIRYRHTDYYGEAIEYLSKELGLNDKEYENYIDSNKTPSQILDTLNNKIFTAKISSSKREDILCSEKLEPVKMHYTFECIDEEYDDYFKKYKSIIKRGGKKRIDLINKKEEVIERFKSTEECATYLNVDKKQVIDMLRYKENKVGRHEIRYSLKNI